MVQITLREFIDQFQQDLNDPVSTLRVMEEMIQKVQNWNQYIYKNDLNT